MLGRIKAGIKAALAGQADARSVAAPGGFELRAPAVQNAVDIFEGQWATDLSDALPSVVAGRHHLLTDERPRQAADALGWDGRLDGISVLELGPLEGAHSYAIEQLGAAGIVAVEANATAFLKCLVVKEALGLERTRFLLGDFSEYLRNAPPRFDLIFACGVLYHMEDPLDLIALIAAASDRCFIWTHYYDADRCPGRTAEPVVRDGASAVYYRQDYGAKGGQFWGGNRDTASWMTRDAILDAFRRHGLTEVSVIGDAPDHENGPCFTFAARRPA